MNIALVENEIIEAISDLIVEEMKGQAIAPNTPETQPNLPQDEFVSETLGLGHVFLKGGVGSGIKGHRTFREVKGQMSRNLKGIAEGKAKRTAVNGNINTDNIKDVIKNMRNEADLYTPYLAPDTAVRMRDFISSYESILHEGAKKDFKNLKAKDLDDFGVDSVQKLVHQEIESNRQSFTDHGIRHLEGNIQRQLEFLDQMGNPTAMDKLSALAIMVNHDMGYTIKSVREGANPGGGVHQSASGKMFDEQKDQWNKDKLFTEKQFNRVSEAIKTHDSSEMSHDNLLNSTRISDNLALFAKEKLPSMFKYVKEGGIDLVQMGQAAAKNDSVAFELARKALHAKIDTSSLHANLKRDLKAGTNTITHMTPKFSLGVLAGEITSIKGDKKGNASVEIQYSAWDSFLQNHFDMGQKQTKKFLGDYGIKDFTKTDYDIGGRLKLKVVGARRKEIGLGMVLKHRNHPAMGPKGGGEVSSENSYGNEARRGHLSAIYDKEGGQKAVEQIMKDTGFTEMKASNVLHNISMYSAKSLGSARGGYSLNAKLMDEFIKASPKFEGKLFRGIKFETDVKEGEIIGGKNLNSWTDSSSTATDFSRRRNAKGNYAILELDKTNAGVSIKYLSRNPYENEVLISRVAKFKVVKVDTWEKQDINGKIIKEKRITVKEILDLSESKSFVVSKEPLIDNVEWMTIQEKWDRDFDFGTFEIVKKKSLGLSTILKHGNHDQSTHGNRHTGSMGSKEPITQEDKNLQSSISQISQMMKMNKRTEGWQNSSGYELVQKDGKFFTPAELPEGIKSGKTKECYTNAGRLALDNPERFTYVEGFASSMGIPMSHAWVVDNKTGKVVDPTWSKKNGLPLGKSYFGIPFSDTYLRETILKTKTWGIIPDYPRDGHNPVKDGFPLDAFHKKSGAEKIDYDLIQDKPKDKVNYHYIEDYMIGGNLKGLSTYYKGGPGSGNFGHGGRIGQVGGSSANPARAGADPSDVYVSSGTETNVDFGRRVIDRAKKIEPGITAKMKALADAVGGRMAGLAFKIKELKSLTDKIEEKAKEENKTEEEARDMMYDVLRYTMVIPASKYDGAEGAVKDVCRKLDAQGYKLFRGKFKNYWIDGQEYKGVNCVFADAKGNRFEVQFHTQQSFVTKMKNHRESYKPKDKFVKALKLAHEKMVVSWAGVQEPPDVQKLTKESVFPAEKSSGDIVVKSVSPDQWPIDPESGSPARYFAIGEGRTGLMRRIYPSAPDKFALSYWDIDKSDWAASWSLMRYFTGNDLDYWEITEEEANEFIRNHEKTAEEVQGKIFKQHPGLDHPFGAPHPGGSVFDKPSQSTTDNTNKPVPMEEKRNKTDEQLKQSVYDYRLLAAVYGYDAKDADFTGMTLSDKFRFDEIEATTPPEFAYTKNSWDLFNYSDFKRPEGLSADELRTLLKDKGLIDPNPPTKDTPQAKLPRSSFIIGENLFKDFSEADREQFIEQYPKHIKKMMDAGTESRIEFFPKKKYGFTVSQIEKLSDNLDAVAGRKGLSGETFTNNKVDLARWRMGEFSQDKDVALSRVLGGWASTGGGIGPQHILREVSISAFKENNYGLMFYDGTGPFVNPGENFYSKSRMESHVRALKSETESFYKDKYRNKKNPDPDLSKIKVTLYRGVGGHPDTYTPAAVESWSKDISTAQRFGKIQSTRGSPIVSSSGYERGAFKQIYSILTAKVPLSGVLWTWESVAGKYGWPPEKELKGKKEHAVIGGVITKKITIERKEGN